MKKLLLFLVFFLAIGICAYAGEGQRLIAETAAMVSEIKPQIDMEKLYADKLQTFIVEMPAEEGRQRRRVVGVILINAPWTEVRETLNNWEAMPEYVAHLEYYRVKYTYPTEDLPDDIIQRRLIEGRIRLPLLITATYPVDVQLAEDNRTEGWRMLKKEEVKRWNNKGVDIASVPRGIRDIGGLGYLESTDDDRTIYYYSPILETTISVPSIVKNTVMRVTLPGYMVGLKKRVESSGTWRR